MRHYVALVHKDDGSDFGVSFPDFPGCVTAGTTLAEAASMASEALTGHVDLMVDEGEPVPEPSSLDDIMAVPEHRDGIPMLVAIARRPERAVRVNVTIPEDVLDRIDRYAAEHGFNRSGFLTHAAKRAMASDRA